MGWCVDSILAKRKEAAGIALSILLCACTASGPPFQPTAIQAADQALIYVYRPNTYLFSTDPDVPFLYLDGNQLIRLRIGGYTWLEVDEGPHTISIKESVIGFPNDTLEEIELVAVSGDTYYLRFSMHIETWGFSVLRPVAVSGTTMEIVPRELGLQEIIDTKFIAIE